MAFLAAFFLFAAGFPLYGIDWEALGRKAGEVQDKAGEMIEDAAGSAKTWWEEEGDPLTQPAREKLREGADAVKGQIAIATEGIHRGYLDYMEEKGEAATEELGEDGPGIHDKFRSWLESAWEKLKLVGEKSPAEIVEGFKLWWKDEGRYRYEDIKDGFYSYVMNLRNRRGALPDEGDASSIPLTGSSN